MKRAGFTMIELIFVIVILGILAAVAIPKLAATRTDAEVSKGASEVATLVSDMGSYYTSQGSFAALSTMTNVITDTPASGTADAQTSNYQAGGENCILITFNDVSDGNVTLSDVANPATAACQGLQTVANDVVKNHVFGGTGVTY
jgi:general secretion pathway protein G